MTLSNSNDSLTLPSIDVPSVVSRPAFSGTLEDFASHTLYVRRSDPDSNPEILYVHGLGGTSLNWTDVMLLQDHVGMSSMAIDLPGFGRSPASDRYTLWSHANAVIDVLRTFEDPPHLVGNSLGGAVTTLVAAQHPDLIRSLTLFAPALPHYRPRRSTAPILMCALPGAATMLGAMQANVSAEYRVDETMKLVMGDLSRINPVRRQEAIDEMARRLKQDHIWDSVVESSRGLGQGFLPWKSEYLWTHLADVSTPTLAVFGTSDRLVHVTVAQGVTRHLPTASVVILPGVGHVPQIERPELMWGMMAEHFHSIPTANNTATTDRLFTDVH